MARPDEVVQRLVVDLTAQPVGHGLDRLAAAVQHQPAQVALTAGALVAAWQGLEDVGREPLQALPDRGQLACCNAPHTAPSGELEGDLPIHHPSNANLTEHY
jgi:hypothetical protein